MSAKNLVHTVLPTHYEDQHIRVVMKPAGIDVGGASPAEPLDPSAVSLSGPHRPPGLVEILAELDPGRSPFRPINRLSRFEAGILVLGKSEDVAEQLRREWKAGHVHQDYLAIVLGKPGARLTIGGPDAPSRDKRRAAVPAVRAARSPTRERLGSAHTTVQLIEHSERRSLVRCRTNAPNTHVLRAQLRSARLRLVGDSLHDSTHRPADPAATFLHLAGVSLKVPGVARPISLRADPDSDPRGYLGREPDLARFLRAALVRRLPLLSATSTNCFRLITGPAEGLGGVVAEVFGRVLVLQIHHRRAADRRWLEQIARWYRDVLDIKTVYVKSFVKQEDRTAGRHRPELHPDKPLFGPPIDGEIVAVENGVRFSIRPGSGLSVGLFLDQRDNRRKVRERSAGKDVLNLFAYTCGFSVAAAVGGAKHTSSVDISPKHLDWGRRNFELNGIDPTDHLFFKSDAADFLDRAQRQGRSFDLIIIDAPSFAHGRSKRETFSIATDLPALIEQATELLRPRGTLLVSTNYRKMTADQLRRAVRQGTGKRRLVLEAPPLPRDFAMDPDHAKSLWVTLSGAEDS